MNNQEKRTGRIVGALFLVVMITWMIGYALIDPLLSGPDYLAQVAANETRIMIGVFVELLEIAAVIGIAAGMYPLFRRQQEGLALGYVALRILESAMLVVIAFSPLFLITLSQSYAGASATESAYLQSLGNLFIEVRMGWTHAVFIPFFYGLGALIFFSLLYQSQRIPRWLAVLGLAGAALLLIGAGLDNLGLTGAANIGLVNGVMEIVLGVWLVVKGFQAPATVQQRETGTPAGKQPALSD